MQGKRHTQVKCKSSESIKSVTIKQTWSKLIPKYPRVSELVGYSSCEDIANALGLSSEATRHRLYAFRKENKIEAILADKNGRLVWMYKD